MNALKQITQNKVRSLTIIYLCLFSNTKITILITMDAKNQCMHSEDLIKYDTSSQYDKRLSHFLCIFHHSFG